MQSLWFFQALGAAIMWGLGYALSERIFKLGLSPGYFLAFLCIFCLPFYLLFVGGVDGIVRNTSLLISSRPLLVQSLIATGAFVIGNLLIFAAVQGKNAAMANIVEVSFPIFTILFAWFLFKDIQIGFVQALGGIFIFMGVGLIYWKS